MTRKLVTAVLLLFLQQQMPAPASIEGTVLRAESNAPIRYARVALTATTQSGPFGPLTATTDSEGRFAIRDISPGTYRMEFAADGYSRMQYGQHVPTGLEGQQGTNLGKPVTLTAGQRLQATVRLTPTGNVSGNLRDIDGRVVANTQVQLIRPVYNQSGEKTFVTVASGETNDRGEYRLYWITPGKYYLAAGFFLGYGIREVRPFPGSPPEYSLSFFPGVSNAANAKVIDVAPGSEVSGMDIRMDPPKRYRIRGYVQDLRTGAPPVSATVGAMYVGFSNMGGIASSPIYSPSDGSFELRDVLSGSYLIAAEVRDPRTGNASSRPVSVTVERSDVERLVLTVTAPVRLPAKVSVEGRDLSSVAGMERFRMSLTPVSNGKLERSFNAPRMSSIAPDGSLTFDGAMFGEYRVTFPSTLPAGVYVKRATYQGKDALAGPIELSDKAGILEVVLGGNPGQIDGTIRDGSNQPTAGVQVVLIPDRSPDRIDLYKTVNADSEGRFTFSDIAPGDYKLYAWEAIEPYSWFDADAIRRYEPLGKTVHIVESSKEIVDLTVIP